MNEEAFQAAFSAAAEPLIQFLNSHPDRLNPHHMVIVTPTSAELVSGERTYRTDVYIK